MIWNKRKKSAVVIYVIIAAVYALLVAIIPFQKSASSWIIYAFTILSVFVGMFVTLFAFSKEETLISKFYGFPVFRIGEIYVAVQIITSIVVFTIDSFYDVPYWIGLGLPILFLGIAAVGVIAADNSRDYIEEIDDKQVSSTKAMTLLQNEIIELFDLCKDEKSKTQFQQLVTKFKYSDPVSTQKSKVIESELVEELQKLERAVIRNDSECIIEEINSITQLLSSRNRICEMSK